MKRKFYFLGCLLVTGMVLVSGCAGSATPSPVVGPPVETAEETAAAAVEAAASSAACRVC